MVLVCQDQRIDLDSFPLHRISDGELRSSVESLIGELESLREALGQGESDWRPAGLGPKRWALLKAILSLPAITKERLYLVVYGHHSDGGPDPSIIAVQLYHLRQWLRLRGFVLTGGGHGRPYAWRAGDERRLIASLERKITPALVDKPPKQSRPIGSIQLCLERLKDGPATAPDLAAGPPAFTVSNVYGWLSLARRRGFVAIDTKRSASSLTVYALTKSGRTWLDAPGGDA